MDAFYGTKIINGEINPKTNEPWKIEDVPKLWRSKTAIWIEEHSNN